MDERDKQKYQNPPASLGTCMLVEFLICHALLVMIAILALYLATQFGLFDFSVIRADGTSHQGWPIGRWMSLIVLEGIIIFISVQYARNQVRLYEQFMDRVEAHQAEDASSTIANTPPASPTQTPAAASAGETH